MHSHFDTITALLPAGHWEKTSTSGDRTNLELKVAFGHLVSAGSILDSDPVGAFQLTYDAARKGMQLYLGLIGIRITATGGHYAYVRVAESGIFQSRAFLSFREMRILRNRWEYPTSEGDLQEMQFVRTFVDSTKSILDEIQELVAGR